MSRVTRIQRFIIEKNLDGALIYQPENRRYYSGFKGSTGYVLVTKSKQIFITDFRYTEQAVKECTEYEIEVISPSITITDVLMNKGIKSLAIEEKYMNVWFMNELKNRLHLEKVEYIDNVIFQDRCIKDYSEILSIKKACEITDLAFEHIIGLIKDGITEAEIDFELRYFMSRFPGVEKMADKFIVASGARGSLPHGIATEKKVKKGELITMDFGCNYCGYWSDLTRTVCVGKADSKQREIYNTVFEAQNTALEVVRAGVTGRRVDKVAREVIDKAGYGKYFGHGLGHSFGLSIHEAPRCAQNPEGDIILQNGMIMTIEPGIYIENWGGVRIEDDIIILDSGFELLSHCNRKLLEL